jgi:hypothetical protein
MLFRFIVYCFIIYVIIYNVLETSVTIEAMNKEYVTNLYNYCPSLYFKNVEQIITMKKQPELYQPYTSRLSLILPSKEKLNSFNIY